VEQEEPRWAEEKYWMLATKAEALGWTGRRRRSAGVLRSGESARSACLYGGGYGDADGSLEVAAKLSVVSIEDAALCVCAECRVTWRIPPYSSFRSSLVET